MPELIFWIYLAMTSWNPPALAQVERYASIAHDLVDVAIESPLYESEDGVARTALLMASIASYESGFRADVDSGKGTGDHGLAHCLMQVHLRKGEDVSDRKDCFRVAAARIRESFSVCRAESLLDRLSGYTRGRCGPNKESQWRMRRAIHWWTAHPFLTGID